MDDELPNRELLESILSVKNYDVITISSGKEALSQDIFNIDLITVDY
ncbi:MAG: hypothetical protein KKH40_07500 [Nanoarchaeota archaeon]|nr:hypothetical protein [Nanoarchaeota archaeon]